MMFAVFKIPGTEEPDSSLQHRGGAGRQRHRAPHHLPPGSTESTHQFREHLEQTSMREATHGAVEILHAKYEKADLPSIVDQQGKPLTTKQAK